MAYFSSGVLPGGGIVDESSFHLYFLGEGDLVVDWFDLLF